MSVSIVPRETAHCSPLPQHLPPSNPCDKALPPPRADKPAASACRPAGEHVGQAAAAAARRWAAGVANRPRLAQRQLACGGPPSPKRTTRVGAPPGGGRGGEHRDGNRETSFGGEGG